MTNETPKPRIVIFSGPRATIQNSAPLVTSDESTPATGYNLLRSQLLAAPVSVYIEAFSAHPMEADVRELYGPPDGWVDPETGEFSEVATETATRPVYRRVLRPEDGPYLLPYAAKQSDGQPWTSTYTSAEADRGGARQVFYPDASRIVAEIDRFGLGGDGRNNLLSSMAEFDFVRPAPSAGYTKGLPADQRTDVGEGDIAPEVPGEDFFSYAPVRREPALPVLARLTNIVHETMATGKYLGGIWLEGSPTNEETIYWLSLLIDTPVPLVGNASQSGHGTLANDGDHNLVQSTSYITSGVWRDAAGKDRVGAVMIQNGQIFTARDVQKADARPGGYVAHGGHGGIIGNTVWDPVLSFIPDKLSTHRSDLRLGLLPTTVTGFRRVDGVITPVDVEVKDSDGRLLAGALPKVTIARYVNYGADDFSNGDDNEVEIHARIDKNLSTFPLAGFIVEGSSPYGAMNESLRLAMQRAVMHGMPVIAVSRGNGGFVPATASSGGIFISGSNLSATKARMLLMACLLKFGSLPVPADPNNPTDFELEQIRKVVGLYQQVVSTH